MPKTQYIHKKNYKLVIHWFNTIKKIEKPNLKRWTLSLFSNFFKVCTPCAASRLIHRCGAQYWNDVSPWAFYFGSVNSLKVVGLGPQGSQILFSQGPLGAESEGVSETHQEKKIPKHKKKKKNLKYVYFEF